MADAPTVVTGNVTTDRLAALQVFERLTQRFSAGFDSSEPQAYGTLLKDLMDNSALLVSAGLMSAKEVLDKIEDLQQHIRKQGTGGRSMPDLFHEWLNTSVEEDA